MRREGEKVEEISDKEGSVKKQVNDAYVVFWSNFSITPEETQNMPHDS